MRPQLQANFFSGRDLNDIPFSAVPRALQSQLQLIPRQKVALEILFAGKGKESQFPFFEAGLPSDVDSALGLLIMNQSGS